MRYATATLLPPGNRAEGAGSSGPFTCPAPNIQKTCARPKFSPRLAKNVRG